MNQLEVGRKRQQIKRQYRYAFKETTRVCLQNTTDYSPFGVTLDGRTIERDFYRRGFNGMEKDDEVKGSGNSYDFGARMYDSRVGRWMSVDPLYFKYAAFSTYSFCYNNPMIVVDKDGKEGIVVSGSPGDHDNKKHFLVNGLDRAISAKNHTKRKGEIVTWIIYDDPTEGQGYTLKQLSEYRKKAEKAGINIMVVSNVDDIVNYVNEKYGGDYSNPGSRARDKITSFYYIGHALPGDLEVGYNGTGENFEPDDFESDAFASGCHVNLLGGCRTNVPAVFEDSNVTQFTEILDKNSTVYGSDVRTFYPGGVASDQELLKKNNGEIIEKKGERDSKNK